MYRVLIFKLSRTTGYRSQKNKQDTSLQGQKESKSLEFFKLQPKSRKLTKSKPKNRWQKKSKRRLKENVKKKLKKRRKRKKARKRKRKKSSHYILNQYS